MVLEVDIDGYHKWVIIVYSTENYFNNYYTYFRSSTFKPVRISLIATTCKAFDFQDDANS